MAVIEASLRSLLRSLSHFFVPFAAQKMDCTVSITANKKARNHRIPPAIPNLFILVEMAVIETASENLSV